MVSDTAFETLGDCHCPFFALRFGCFCLNNRRGVGMRVLSLHSGRLNCSCCCAQNSCNPLPPPPLYTNTLLDTHTQRPIHTYIHNHTIQSSAKFLLKILIIILYLCYLKMMRGNLLVNLIICITAMIFFLTNLKVYIHI